MSDGFSATMDTDHVIALLDRLGDAARPFLMDASRATGEAIVREAQARLGRQLGPQATGATVAGITTRPAFDGNGYVVLSEREPFPTLPLWLEKGTTGKHGQHARPYFYASALLEEGNHLRRVEQALRECFQVQGLGD